MALVHQHQNSVINQPKSRNHLMDFLVLSSDEWRTLVFIPATVALVVNLVSPFLIWTFKILLNKVAKSIGNKQSPLLRLLIKQLEQEIEELRAMQSDPNAILIHYRQTLRYQSTALWLMFLAPFLGLLAQLLATSHAHLISGELGTLLNTPWTVFAMVFGSLFAAGPFQALVSSTMLRKKLDLLINNPEALFHQLENQKKLLIEALNHPS